MHSSGDIMFSKKLPTQLSLNYLKGAFFRSTHEICDVVSVAALCAVDNTVMLVVEPGSNEHWIPSVKVNGENSWLGAVAKDLLQEIFGAGVSVNKVLRFNKLWMPSSRKTSYITHSIFEVVVPLELKKKSKTASGRFKGKIRWSSLEDIMKYFESNVLKSPEVVDFAHWISNKSSPVTNIPTDYLVAGNFLEITENVLVFDKNTIYDQIVDASGIDRFAQEIIYKEFLLMCFPSIYLTLPVFDKFALAIGWSKEEIPHLYRSADLHNRRGISFREFLYFLAATEPETSHGGGLAEFRCRYIFRYLDANQKNVLTRDEVKNFICLVRKARKQSLEASKIASDISECYQAIGVAEGHGLTISEFLRAVGELKVRGTSQIYRAPSSIKKVINDIIAREARYKSVRSSNQGLPDQNEDYEMAIHSVKIQKSGNLINIEQYWNIENAVSVSSTRPMGGISRKISADKFDQSSKSNELLKVLRYLSQINKTLQCYVKLENFEFSWGNLDPSNFAKQLFAVCSEVKEVLKRESRMLEISSPVYIMGDIHGNLADLLHFEKILWHVGPGLCPCNLLFLGDYVDRGLYSLEICCYLFAYKLQNPRKVFLIRGNHEIRRVQSQWTFEKECKIKFGDKLGNIVFNAINDVFDTLPLAAVVDGKVFCCHGGIPPPWLCPVASAINEIPVVLNEPQDQSSLAWELMWNDPLRSRSMNEKVTMELLANEGFAVNSRRGTGHVFSVEALERFLAVNRYTHLVRAHEVVEAGFYLQQKGKLLTVFSSSKYCGGQNMAACILADQEKLRILRLEME